MFETDVWLIDYATRNDRQVVFVRIFNDGNATFLQ